jgi:hypothetical protein
MSINQLPAKTFFSESVQSLSTRVLLSAVGGQKESICHHPPVHGSKQAAGGLSFSAQKLSSTEERLLLSSVVEPFFLSFLPVRVAPEAFWQEQPSQETPYKTSSLSSNPFLIQLHHLKPSL